MKNKTSNRRLIFQLTAVVVLIVIAYAMTIIGRGHTVYLDNKKLEYNGKTYDTPYKVVVLVDGEQVAKLYDRERGSATCIGQKFTVTLEITEKKGGSETTQTYTIPLPKNMDEIKQVLREEIDYPGTSVVIARRECIQTLKRHLKAKK